MRNLYSAFEDYMHKKIDEFIDGSEKGELDVTFRVCGDDGKPVLETKDPKEFKDFLEKLRADQEKEEAKPDEAADVAVKDEPQHPCGYAGDCSGECDGCDCQEECSCEEFEDELTVEPDLVSIYEIPVSGVLAAAALIGSVAALIAALRRR